MVVGTAILEFNLKGVRSLKEKRGIIKSLIAQLQKKFNASVAEVDLHDAWQSAAVGVAVVSTSSAHAEEMLDNICSWIEHFRPDLEFIGPTIEVLHL